MATRKPGLSPQLRIIEDIHDRLGLAYAEIASAVGADEAALEAVAPGPSRARRRLHLPG